MKLEEYRSLTQEQKDKHLDTLMKGYIEYRSFNIKFDKCVRSVNYLSALYYNVCFPIINKSDLSIDLDPENILNGNLISYTNNVVNCKMSWSGYASQMYDGQLALFAQSKDSKIIGMLEVNDKLIPFEFDHIYPKNFIWPGFLCLFGKE